MIGIIRADGSTVRVIFAHHQEKVERGKSQQPIAYLHPARKKNRGPIRAVTFAYLEGGTKDHPICYCVGQSRCAMADGFEKEKGRQMALGAAIIDGISKGVIASCEAGPLFASYYNRPRGSRAPKSTSQENLTS